MPRGCLSFHFPLSMRVPLYMCPSAEDHFADVLWEAYQHVNCSTWHSLIQVWHSLTCRIECLEWLSALLVSCSPVGNTWILHWFSVSGSVHIELCEPNFHLNFKTILHVMFGIINPKAQWKAVTTDGTGVASLSILLQLRSKLPDLLFRFNQSWDSVQLAAFRNWKSPDH